MLNSKFGLRQAANVVNLGSSINATTNSNGDNQSYVIAKYDYASQGPQELTIKKGERLTLLDDSKHWWKVINSDNLTGFVPSNYVKREKQSLFDSIKRGIRVNAKKKATTHSDISPSSTSMSTNLMDNNMPTTSHNHLQTSFNQLSSINGHNQQTPQQMQTTNSELLVKELGPQFNAFNHITSSPNNNNSAPPDHCIDQAKVMATVKYNYKSQQTDELSLNKGATVVVLEKSSDGWWKGELKGTIGWFPSNYVTELQAPMANNISAQPKNLNHDGLIRRNLPTANNSNFESVIANRNSSAGNALKYNDLFANDLFANSSNSNHDSTRSSSPPSAQKTVLHVVVALYSFQSQNDEELSFEKDEYLDIVEKPINDPDWWRACNQNGELGLVPKNYIQLVPGMKSIRNWSDKSPAKQPPRVNKPSPSEASNLSQNSSNNMDHTSNGVRTTEQKDSNAISELIDEINSLNLNEKVWYHGQMSRNQCDQLLNAYAEDGYFVIRNSETNAGDFSVSLKAPVRNKHFRVHYVNRLFCIGQRKFNTLEDLIEHYKKTPIYTSPDGEKMFLKKAYPREVM